MSEPDTEIQHPSPAPVRAGIARRTIAMFAAAATVLVLAVAAAGAFIGHELWKTNGSESQASGFPSRGSFGGSGLGNGSSNSSTSGAPADIDGIAAKVDPAIVDINSNLGYQDASGAGTGIVVSSDGEVLTNNHVISGSTNLTATDVGNGKTYKVTVIGYDPSHDIAVLKLQGASGLQTAKLADSSDAKVGDPVVGIGNAGGGGGTPASAGGKITALNTSITAADSLARTSEKLSGLIEVNAAIQSGDSGGPLVDEQGEVLGIDTAGSGNFAFQSGGAGYAIPIDEAMETEKLIMSGKDSSSVHIGATAFLGVELGSSTGRYGYNGYGYGQQPTTSGAPIGGVLDGKPAAQAGLGAGDTITSLGGQSIGSPADLGSAMLAHHPGDDVALGWTDSSGQSHTAKVELTTGPPA